MLLMGLFPRAADLAFHEVLPSNGPLFIRRLVESLCCPLWGYTPLLSPARNELDDGLRDGC